MRRFWIMLLGVAVALAIALPAGAGKPDCDLDPSHAACDRGSEVESQTCEELVANGASWVLGQRVGDHYAAFGVPACIDLDHGDRAAQYWEVRWVGDTRKGTVKGLGLAFKRGLPGEWYADTVATSESGVWDPWPLVDPEDGPFIFVAMPHQGDKWDTITLVVTPRGQCSDEDC
jgi:hypothetical protein